MKAGFKGIRNKHGFRNQDRPPFQFPKENKDDTPETKTLATPSTSVQVYNALKLTHELPN